MTNTSVLIVKIFTLNKENWPQILKLTSVNIELYLSTSKVKTKVKNNNFFNLKNKSYEIF